MNFARSKNEIAHGILLSQDNTEKIWGWGTPAGRLRAKRRADLIARSTGLKPGMSVLEIGCGTGIFTEMFAATGAKLLAVDISPDLLKKARARGLPSAQVTFKESRFEECDIDGPFDAVIGSSILHHLEIQPALSKTYKLLKPGGILAFAEPNFLNPQVFFMFKFRSLFPYVSPDENPFLRWKLQTELLRTGFENPNITPFDWLHPNTPKPLIARVEFIGLIAERIPLLREFAGSLLIRARRPALLS